MRKRILLLVIITFICIFFTGCYDSNSIEKFYYVIAIGLDKGENTPLKLSLQIALSDNSTDSSSQSTKGNIYTVECDSLDSGLAIIDNYLSKKISLSHLSAIIFSEELAHEGIFDLINDLANNNEISPNCRVLISSSSSVELMEKVSDSGQNFSARFYEFIINSNKYTGYSTISKFLDLFYSVNNNITQGTANYIEILDKNIQSNGIAVIKKGTMVGKLSPTESIAHSIVINEAENAVVSIENPFDNNLLMDINVTLHHTSIDVDIVNNTPYIKVKPQIFARIKSITPNLNYSSVDNLSIIEESLNNYLNKIILDYLYKISREFNSDICYFGEIYSTKCLTLDEFNSIHWETIFEDAVFDVETNSNVNSLY